MTKIIKLKVFFVVLFLALIFPGIVLSSDFLFIDKGDTEEYEIAADTYQGYEWVVSTITDPSIMKYEGKEFEYGEKNTDLSVQKIKFKGLKKGKTTVTLQYIKQGDMVPKKTKTITIKVY